MDSMLRQNIKQLSEKYAEQLIAIRQHLHAHPELSYKEFETSKFKKLLKELPTDHNVHAAFTPNKMTVPFDDKYLNEINAWLPEHGDKIIHIYGTLDTWSASAVPPSDKVDALWFFMNGKHHANALISTMTPEERTEVVSALERWLNMGID